MKYDLMYEETVERVIETYENRDDSINEKCEEIKKKKDNFWSSDFDRFAGISKKPDYWYD